MNFLNENQSTEKFAIVLFSKDPRNWERSLKKMLAFELDENVPVISSVAEMDMHPDAKKILLVPIFWNSEEIYEGVVLKEGYDDSFACINALVLEAINRNYKVQIETM